MCLALMVDMVAREVRRVVRGRAVRVIAVIILKAGSVLKCARSIRDVSVCGKTVDCEVIEAIKARDNIILKLGCGSEAFIYYKGNSTIQSSKSFDVIPITTPPIPESMPSSRGLPILAQQNHTEQ